MCFTLAKLVIKGKIYNLIRGNENIRQIGYVPEAKKGRYLKYFQTMSASYKLLVSKPTKFQTSSQMKN